MPLIASVLEVELGTMFAAPPATYLDCAHAWADAVRTYAAAIVPSSTTVSAAANALASSLAAAFALPSAVAGMEAAFAAFAAAVGFGMTGYVPTPPPAAVGFATQFAGPAPATSAAAAQQLAALVHAWLTTGTSTLAVPPNTLVPWS
jgi:hypothetical protein